MPRIPKKKKGALAGKSVPIVPKVSEPLASKSVSVAPAAEPTPQKSVSPIDGREVQRSDPKALMPAREVHARAEALFDRLETLAKEWTAVAMQTSDHRLVLVAPSLFLAAACRSSTRLDAVRKHLDGTMALLLVHPADGVEAAVTLFKQRLAWRAGHAHTEPSARRPSELPALPIADITWLAGALVTIAERSMASLTSLDPTAYDDLVSVMVSYLAWWLPGYPRQDSESAVVARAAAELRRRPTDEPVKIARAILRATEPAVDVDRAMDTLSARWRAGAEGDASDAEVGECIQAFEVSARVALGSGIQPTLRERLLNAGRAVMRETPDTIGQSFVQFIVVEMPSTPVAERTHIERLRRRLRQMIVKNLQVALPSPQPKVTPMRTGRPSGLAPKPQPAKSRPTEPTALVRLVLAAVGVSPKTIGLILDAPAVVDDCGR